MKLSKQRSGSPEAFMNALNNRIDELNGNSVESATITEVNNQLDNNPESFVAQVANAVHDNLNDADIGVRLGATTSNGFGIALLDNETGVTVGTYAINLDEDDFAKSPEDVADGIVSQFIGINSCDYTDYDGIADEDEPIMSSTSISRIVDWLYDHRQAADDCEYHFGVSDLNDVPAEDLIGWIYDHGQLWSDFVGRFPEDAKQFVEDVIGEDWEDDIDSAQAIECSSNQWYEYGPCKICVGDTITVCDEHGNAIQEFDTTDDAEEYIDENFNQADVVESETITSADIVEDADYLSELVDKVTDSIATLGYDSSVEVLDEQYISVQLLDEDSKVLDTFLQPVEEIEPNIEDVDDDADKLAEAAVESYESKNSGKVSKEEIESSQSITASEYEHGMDVKEICDTAVQAIEEFYPYDVKYYIKGNKIVFTVEYRYNDDEYDYLGNDMDSKYSTYADELDIFGDDAHDAGVGLADDICTELGLVPNSQKVESGCKVESSMDIDGVESKYAKYIGTSIPNDGKAILELFNEDIRPDTLHHIGNFVFEGETYNGHEVRIFTKGNPEGTAIVITAVDSDEDDEWIELKSKQVEDSDGFMTDYTLYMHKGGNKYICMFGDKELYTPDEDWADWECETKEEADEWFNSYKGFAEDEGDEYEYVDY